MTECSDGNHSAELILRRDLAACFRLAALYGWDDLLATHMSARIPGENGAFLLNPYGLLFEETTASSLIKLDMAGNLLAPTPNRINPAAFVIHSAIYGARPDVAAAVHLHTKDGVAVSMLECGLLPLNQASIVLSSDIGYHEYEGVAVHLQERARLQEDLGLKNYLILRNHGTLAVGASIAEAFVRMYNLEWACTVQVRAQGSNQALHKVADKVVAKMRSPCDPVVSTSTGDELNDLLWPALLRKVRRLDSSFEN